MAKIYTFKLIKLLLNNLKVLDYSTLCFCPNLSSAGFELSRVKLEQLCNENAEDIDCGSSSRDVRVSYGLNIWTLRVTGI